MSHPILEQLSTLLHSNTETINRGEARIKELEETVAGQLESINLLKQRLANQDQEITKLTSLVEQKEINSRRMENHVQKLAMRCSELSERCNLMKFKDPGILEWEQIKNKTIQKLTMENLKLFKKIGEERSKFNLEIECLKRKIESKPESDTETECTISQLSNIIEKPDLTNGMDSEKSEIASLEIYDLPPFKNQDNLDTPKNSNFKEQDKLRSNSKSISSSADGNERNSPINSSSTVKIIDIPSSPFDLLKSGSPIQISNPKTPGEKSTSTTLGEKTNPTTPVEISNLKRSYSSITPRTADRPAFKYQEVVRDKETRRKMHGRDCSCCTDYYRLTADLKPLRELGAAHRDRRQVISRHRDWSKKPDTPPWYWDVDFPTTQEIESTKKRKTGQ
ncbi:hypothetical protein HDV04_004240 [Boothiomyces sp. JEL0838]|nr:hypothetical protein HDV04_004240 [Boothiomyces sp. JEL0838]